eukprot:Nk52_evm21s295 gene=Nk52_evmTU21s295
MESEALKRKEKLKALREAKLKKEAATAGANGEQEAARGENEKGASNGMGKRGLEKDNDEKREGENDVESDEGVGTKGGAKRLKFRNYQPRNSGFTPVVDEARKTTEGTDDQIDIHDGKKNGKEGSSGGILVEKPVFELPNVEKETEDLVADAKKSILPEGDELDVLSLAPRKANWDLKKAMEKKVKLLEKKTQNAIVTLIRQRVGNQQTK